MSSIYSRPTPPKRPTYAWEDQSPSPYPANALWPCGVGVGFGPRRDVTATVCPMPKNKNKRQGKTKERRARGRKCVLCGVCSGHQVLLHKEKKRKREDRAGSVCVLLLPAIRLLGPLYIATKYPSTPVIPHLLRATSRRTASPGHSSRINLVWGGAGLSGRGRSVGAGSAPCLGSCQGKPGLAPGPGQSVYDK